MVKKHRTKQRTRIIALAAAITLGVSACDFLDDLKDLADDLVAGGVSFNTAGDVTVAGARIADGGRAAESYEASQKIADNTDQAIADFVMERDASALTDDVSGPYGEANQFDKSIEVLVGEGAPAEVEVAQLDPNARASQDPLSTQLGIGLDPANNQLIRKSYPGYDGSSGATFSTYVYAGVGEANTQLYRIGMTVNRVVKNGITESVVIIPERKDLTSRTADPFKGTTLSGLLLTPSNLTQPQPIKDANGDYRGAVVGVHLESNVKVPGTDLPVFARDMEVRATVGKDGRILFEAIAPISITPTPDPGNPFIQFLINAAEFLKPANEEACRQIPATSGCF